MTKYREMLSIVFGKYHYTPIQLGAFYFFDVIKKDSIKTPIKMCIIKCIARSETALRVGSIISDKMQIFPIHDTLYYIDK